MESIAASLTPRQKARLHEVADLMLQIYNTLARMRYLDPVWIQPGPHDLTAQMPQYESLGLDPSIIYLYHILPYIDSVKRYDLDFYDGGYFIDLRDPEQIERARNPMFGDDPKERMRPWMTPLSRQGNHTSVILYDAKRHVVGIFNPNDGGSSDRNLPDWWFMQTGEDGTERYFRRFDGVETECSKEEWEEADRERREAEEAEEDDGEEGDEEEDDDDDDDDEEEEEEEDENYWDEMDARPAAKVLRDIIRWYHELVELPGTGENNSGWSKDPVPTLYKKHGWPGEDFDGEAFLVDKLRAEAVRKAHADSQRPFDEVKSLQRQLEAYQEREPKLHEKAAAAKTLDEKWLARWELFRASKITPGLQKRLEGAQEAARLRQLPKPEDLPLLELKQIHMDLLTAKRKLAEWRGRTPDTEPIRYTAAKIREGVRATEQSIALHEKAHAACRADADRLCPGRAPLPFVGGEESNGWDLRGRVADLADQIEGCERGAEELRGWIAALPEGVVEARKLAEEDLERCVVGKRYCEKAWRTFMEIIEAAAKRKEAGDGGES
ncbi:hypothetical protein C8A05DRAFT_19805 [Staphylotrichum tortipilum]|uniref:Uncharacterized protein n=1 Tax=Staphylotrichum tortipilum TaxID=2831512 RepID=A0AAN6MC50_9PEZI|nr:hypothetical protein C8A05DRAFT_19805 [Staphylotrichum longicolle]